jgi:nitroimidazol reductase NimA-like FMN-containing flavoprotein (pyridoxamine 5'-phosphate oxidase superfamily)
MRRQHCRIDDPREMENILNQCTIGRMATVDAQGYPYITPVNYVYHQGKIYFHCALQGEKLDNIERDSKVGFEVDIPLSYLEVGFNEEPSPCKTHQLFHCVVIRGTARVVPPGDLKIEALNALVAKHEGNSDFPPVTEELPAYKIAHVVEISPHTMTGKSDLIQNKDDEVRRKLAGQLAERGRPEDLEAVKAMGFELVNDNDGWRVK